MEKHTESNNSISDMMYALNSDYKDGVFSKDDYRDNMLCLFDAMNQSDYNEEFNEIILKLILLLREDFKDGVYTKNQYKSERSKLIDKISKTINHDN